MKREAFPFPPPGDEFGPRRIAAAASSVLTDDFQVNVERIYPLIGFDADELMEYLRYKRKEKALIDKGRVPALSKLQKSIRNTVRAIGLELISGLLLAALDSPTRAVCPCRVYMNGDRPVPMAPAGKGQPDAWADYRGFTILVEATMRKRTGPEKVESQYNGAVTHMAAALEGRQGWRGYCFMVSRAKLHQEHVPRLIVQAQETLASRHGLDNARVLAFGIEEIAHIAEHLDRIYADGKDVPALTAEDLSELLDALHDAMMERIASGEEFPDHWAARTFVGLLRKHARRQPMRTLFDRKDEQTGEVAEQGL